MRIRIPALVSLLCLGLIFSLPGCGGDEDNAGENGGTGADGENATGNGGEEESGGETAGTGGGGSNGGGGTTSTPSASAVPVGTNVADGFDVDVMHYNDQGSGFFPMSIIRALNDSVTGEPFLDNLERFGLLPGEVSEKNPEGFPVGIVTNTIKFGDHEVEARTRAGRRTGR